MRLRRAFTLVELLVVIGIIAVLISLLLPVLRNAREQARMVVCASNMRQVMQGILSYADANKGAMPDPDWRLPQDLVHYPYYAVQLTAIGQYDYQNGALWPYVAGNTLSRQRVFSCPSDESDRYVGIGVPARADPTRPRNFSYNFNGDLIYPQSLPSQSGIKLTQIRGASHKIILIEQALPAVPPGGVAAVGPPDANGDPIALFLTSRHQGFANEGFADGHVELIDRKIFDNPQATATGAASVGTAAYVHYIDLGRSD